jgi:diguanylate cyclase (GGDEF)-like protein
VRLTGAGTTFGHPSPGERTDKESETMIEARSAHKRSVKESLLLLLCGSLAIAVTVLAYLRLRDEHWTLAFVDVGVISIMLLVFVFVYFSRRTRTIGILMALGFIGAALMSTLLLGTREVYWAFPALMLAYFMLDARQATILTGGFAGCFLAIVWDELPAVDLTKICLALVTTVLLANAFSLTNRRQLADLRRMVNIDPLTGAGNRRAQNLKLDSACAIFRRNERAASVLLLDIDFFKQINDTHGHIVGDQILVELSELVKRNTRATESLYRYGGEEFVVVAEQTSLDAAVNLAEKLRSQTERELFAAGIRITVSIGVAELQRGEEKEDWLRRADAALYRAKGRGRNKVIVADNLDSRTLSQTAHLTMHGLSSAKVSPTRQAVLSRTM